MLQSIEVVTQPVQIVEVHIEAAKIKARWLQKFGSGIIGECRKALWCDLLYRVAQLTHKTLDSSAPIEADDVIRDLVDDTDRQYGRVIRSNLRRIAHLSAGGFFRR